MMEKNITTFLKKVVSSNRNRHYHKQQKEKADRCYHEIIAQYPEHTISSRQRKIIDEYSHDTFGSSVFSPWLRTYAAYRGAFVEGWIPGNYFSRILTPRLVHYQNFDAKTISRRILGTDRIPDIAYHLNGFWLDREHREIPPGALKDVVFADTSTVFVKLDRSYGGRDVWKVDRTGFDPEELSALGDLVLQSPISQHPFFDQFTPDSVATLRIITVKQAGTPARNRASHLRLGRHGSTIVRTAEDIRVAVMDDDGTLGERGCGKRWASLSAHPDSGVAFAGATIPGFGSAVALCERLHDESPISMVIGWDIAIDVSGEPVLMEWNQGRIGIRFSEASIGPCFTGLGWEDVWKNP